MHRSAATAVASGYNKATGVLWVSHRLLLGSGSQEGPISRGLDGYRSGEA
jgi:hypothetical protein